MRSLFTAMSMIPVGTRSCRRAPPAHDDVRSARPVAGPALPARPAPAYDRGPRTISSETENAMRRTSRVVNFVLLATCLAVTLTSPDVARGQGNLTLYCSPQIEWCQLMIAEFTKATVIKVAMTRKSSGE